MAAMIADTIQRGVNQGFHRIRVDLDVQHRNACAICEELGFQGLGRPRTSLSGATYLAMACDL